jgi:hypothetical protein
MWQHIIAKAQALEERGGVNKHKPRIRQERRPEERLTTVL